MKAREGRSPLFWISVVVGASLCFVPLFAPRGDVSPRAGFFLDCRDGNAALLSPARLGERHAYRIDFLETAPGPSASVIARRYASVRSGERYRVGFRAAADAPRRLRVVVRQAGPPWAELAPSRVFAIGPEESALQFAFEPSRTEPHAQIDVEMGGNPVGLTMTVPEIEPAGRAETFADPANDPPYEDRANESPARPEWTFYSESSDAAEGTLPQQGGPAKIVVHAVAPLDPWTIQLKREALRVERGKSYRLKFKARAAPPRRATVLVIQDREPWRELGLRRDIELDSDVKEFEATFAATESSGASVCFYLGGPASTIEVDGLEFEEANP